MQINLEKGAAKNVIDLINATNGSALTSAEIALGQPAEWTDPEGINTRNTSLTISAVPDSGYTGTVEVRYHRLDLASLASGKTLSYTKSDTSTLQTLLESVATQLGVVEEAVKLDVDAMPPAPANATPSGGRHRTASPETGGRSPPSAPGSRRSRPHPCGNSSTG